MNLENTLEIEKQKIPANMARSGKWASIRAAYLKQFPYCAVCGGTKKSEVHHIRPFHLHPDLELDETNFITLCEANKDGIDCHLGFGHLGNFKSFNINIVNDAAIWHDKINNRPLCEEPAQAVKKL